MKFNNYLVQKREYPLSIYAQKAQQMKEAGVDVINLTIGDPLDNTFPKVYERLCTEVAKLKNSQYPVGKGHLAYREAVANWAKRNHGIELNANTDVVSCNGSKEAVFHLPLLFDWSDGAEMFFASMSYPVYAASAAIYGIKTRELPLSEETGFLPDLDAIDDETWRKCRVFWLNSPHNPTTAEASKEYFAKLLALAEKYDFLLCSDECYNDICYGTEQPVSALDFAESKHWVVFRSLSKRSHITGLRIGAIISKNEEIMSHMVRLRAPMGVGSPTFIQDAAIEAWNDDQHPKDFSVEYKKKRDMIFDVLEEKGFKIFGGDAAFYLWFSHPKLEKSTDILELFLEHGIVLSPGTAFGQDGEGYVRLVYCITLEVCQKLVERIKAFEIS